MLMLNFSRGSVYMGVLTEYQLKKELKDKDIKEYEVEKGVIITPSARQYLKDNNIEIVIKDRIPEAREQSKAKEAEESCKPKYKTINGGYLYHKPEFMTQLYGNTLVIKNHKRIVLRGKLDSLQSKILEAQVLAARNKQSMVVEDLEEVLAFVRNILKAEVLEQELDPFYLLGMNKDELRRVSHNPEKYFGMKHVLPEYKMGELAVALNSLRSSSREVEIAAINAFVAPEGKTEREDIITSLNRLSSCFYIMLLRLLAGKYSKR